VRCTAFIISALFLGAACNFALASQHAAGSLDAIVDGVLAHQKGPSLPVIMNARISERSDRTRFVVELSDPVPMRAFTLTNPDRVVVDMPAVEWHIEKVPRPSVLGRVRGYRFGIFRSGNSRFVIDLSEPVAVAEPVVLPPEKGYGFRAVIDLVPTTREAFERGAGWPADLKAREAAAEELALGPVHPASLTSQRKVIVIDPGHGGIDSGTNGTNGLMEKDVVLDVGLRVARALEQKGTYLVHMTRDTDTYVPLSERVRIARSWHADLFISLHADSNPDSGVSGLSVYTLSERGSDREAAALARKENQSDIVAGVDLSGANSQVAPILIDLAQRDTLNRSSRFALTALDRLGEVTDLLAREPHRSAAFVVLEAPDIPAALIELGYLSNEGDAARMESTVWRGRTADAIARAVDRQFSTQAAADFGSSARP